MSQNQIIVALDFPTADQALALADQIDPNQCRVKVGKELFTRAGPEIVKALTNKGFDVFLDLKFHDIPNTTANACLAAADLGAWMVNVHAHGGRKMMESAKQKIENYDIKLIAPSHGPVVGTDQRPEDPDWCCRGRIRVQFPLA